MTEKRPSKQDAFQRPFEPEKTVAAGARTLVVGPYLTRKRKPSLRPDPGGHFENPRPPQARLEEIVGLSAAIDLHIMGALVAPLTTVRPATFLGSGKVEELKGTIAAEEIALVVMDCALSPVQQRNLEKAWSAKVIDRTGLILEIFGRRAHTREGILQVELAHLSYQKGRLVRSWTHLERQRGGFGFLGGPGETQIEADRRQIQERMTRIERDLQTVVQTRALHRRSRKRVPYPVIALVGYTNAGKSTLFNRLTTATVLAQDMLFATLDPTSRAVDLPHGEKAILTDTVGFISDLPTMLVAAFRATLEDVIAADILLHVRDVSHGETQEQAQDVEGVLRDIGIDPTDRQRLIEVWNKSDLLSLEDRQRLSAFNERKPPQERAVLISAMTGEGISHLLRTIEDHIAVKRPRYEVTIPAHDGQALAWLYENTEILSRDIKEDGSTTLEIRLPPDKEPRLLNRFAQARRT